MLKTLDVKYSTIRFLTNEIKIFKRVLFQFGGDVQTIESDMKYYHKQSLERILNNLEKSQVDSKIFVVLPDQMSKGFSLFDSFTFSQNEYGDVYFKKDGVCSDHLFDMIDKCLARQLPIDIIGFSKGCIVLNQMCWEMHMNKFSVSYLLKWLRNIIFIDPGHNGEGIFPNLKFITDLLISKNIYVYLFVTNFQFKKKVKWYIKDLDEFKKLMGKFLFQTEKLDQETLFDHFDSIDQFLRNITIDFKERVKSED